MFCNNRGQKSSPLVLDSDDDEAMYEVGERARMEAAPMQTSGLLAAPMESGATNGQAGALGSAVEGEAMFVEDGSHAVYRREDTAIDRDEYDHRGYYDPTVVSPNAYDEETNVESEVKAEEVDDELFNTIQDPFAPTGELKYFSGGTEEDKQKMALDMPGTILEKTENGGIRKRPIINRNAPAQRKRKLLEPDMERKLVKECKWLFFLHMNHEVVGAKEEIVARCAPHLNMKDLPLDYEDLFREIIRKVNTYRQPLIQKAIVSYLT